MSARTPWASAYPVRVPGVAGATGPVHGRRRDAGLPRPPLLTGTGLRCLGPAECDRLPMQPPGGRTLSLQGEPCVPLSLQLDRRPTIDPLVWRWGSKRRGDADRGPHKQRGQALWGMGGQVDAQPRPGAWP